MELSVARNCLLSGDVFRSIASFQRGIYLDMALFLAMKKPAFTHYNLAPVFAPVDAVLAPWLNEYGTGRLSVLFNTLRHMRPIVVMYAIYSGRLSLLQFIHDHDIPLSQLGEFLVDLAAWCGQLDIVKFLLAINHPGCTSHAMYLVCRNGHLEIVKVLHAAQKDCNQFAMDAAAAHNHMDIVSFLHFNRSEGCTTAAMDKAAANGHLQVVQWLHSHRLEGCTAYAMDDAAAGGHFDVVRFLHENRHEGCTEMAMCGAAARGHLDILTFLHANRDEGCAFFALDKAAKNGHLEIVKWLHAHKPHDGSTDAIDFAAKNGHVEVVKFLLANRSMDLQ
ncbi:hypothetical protein AeMF1_007154 [Aphanomyces euteiches]|nr:hypothetical protein AeMF1_007154 [Aphanomyces euteiches]